MRARVTVVLSSGVYCRAISNGGPPLFCVLEESETLKLEAWRSRRKQSRFGCWQSLKVKSQESFYCTISINSTVTRHRPSKIDEMSQL